MNDFLKTIIKRFLRGAAAGAVSTMILIVPSNISSYHELANWLNALAIAGSIGIISGLLQAADKAIRYTPDTNV